MTITEFHRLSQKGKKNKRPSRVIKTMGHCYNGCGWILCDFWWKDKKDNSRCSMFGNAVKNASESLNICNSLYSIHYEGDA